MLKKTSAYSGTKTLCNISNWACWVYDNGQSAHSPNGSSGGIYPKGTAEAIYQDGFIWGGKVDTDGDGIGDRIRVGGQQYNIGTVPGWVISGGDVGDALVADPSDPAVRVYRIRSDYQHMSDSELIEDAAIQNQVSYMQVTNEMKQAIIDQYEQDWEEWPVDRGAPFYDKDDDGIYTAGVDEPGIANADQVLWFVVNDYDRLFTTAMFGSEPIGFELQITLWAYDDKESRFGQSIFKSYKLINKSNSKVEDMYIAQWSDPDIGSASDDYAGCDTTLSMGYCYNGEATDADYDVYGLSPAAAGYVLLQGPMVASPGDTAIYELNNVQDYKNLPMTSYGWFSAGSALDDPELGDYIGTLQYYNLIRGYKPIEDAVPVPWTLGNVAGAAETHYPLHGDPTIPGASEVDGTESYFTPGDRRMCVSSGPFDFAPGDIQEVMFALVGGLGADNIMSVSDMKLNASLCRSIFDDRFASIPNILESPRVNCRPFEKSLILEWGSDHEWIDNIEQRHASGYKFEGYNVYQVPYSTSERDEATKIATFDVINSIKVINDTRYLAEFEGEAADVPVAFGDDTGIQRYIKIDWDHINDCPLYEGKTYYYAVTAYNQNISDDRLGAKMYESSFIPMAVILQEELPGNKLQSYEGQSDIPVEHISGNGEGNVKIKVIDPYSVTGDDYSIELEYDQDSSQILFKVVDEDGIVLSYMNPLVSDTSLMMASPIIDGLEILLYSPEMGVDSIVQLDEPNGNIVDSRLFNSLNYRGDGSESWHTSAGAPYFTIISPSGNINGALNDSVFAKYRNWEDAEIEIVFGDSSIAWSYNSNTVLDEEVPFAIYKYTADGQVRRQFISVRDDQVDSTQGTWDIGIEHDYYMFKSYEDIFSYDNSGDGYLVSDEQAYLDANDLNALPSRTGFASDGNPFYYPQLTHCRITMYNNEDMPADGTVIRFKTNKPLGVDDEFYFSTSGYEQVNNDSLMQAAIDKINVFPNPYYGYELIR
ncbi:MAG: hypothetical protein J7L40_01580, partial [Candidatus Marinimicrobia bacterium]|nr:hypothetical protein [Candidatus Neomarinimicrobiota bacterium]